jgi:hypothetical protein
MAYCHNAISATRARGLTGVADAQRSVRCDRAAFISSGADE